MTVPVGVDGVLWQQAVEAAADAICQPTQRFTTDAACAHHREQAARSVAAAFGVLQQATRAQIGPMQYLTTHDCDGTVAAHWKRGLITPRHVPDWEPATADEVAAAAFRCPYCAGIFDGPGQCYIYDKCVQAGPVVARGETPTEETG